jgi:SET family sugar efflux transporter-like MFS transporter
VTVYGATASEVGWILAVYNASGFVASLVLPAYADRKQDYLRPMLACGLLTLALAALLALATTLPAAVVGLLVLGGPAGVGSSLLFAQLKHSGAGLPDVVNTRAIVSFAWVAGPPLATFIMAGFGNRAILLAIALVAGLNIATTAAMLGQRWRARNQLTGPPEPAETTDGPADARAMSRTMSRTAVVVIVGAFVILQATNYAVVVIMSVFVTKTLGLKLIWGGIALGVAAGVEIPALLLIGRLGRRYSDLGLIATGCLAGIAYYVGMSYVSGPVVLIGLQVLNAWFFAAVAGVGLALFQRIIPRPGLASGLYTNTRRLGAIGSGPIISFGSLTALGYSGIFAVCAALTVLALILIGVVGRTTRSARTPLATPSLQPRLQ